MATQLSLFESAALVDGADPGTGKQQKNLATRSATEGGKEKHWQRFMRDDVDGATLQPVASASAPTVIAVAKTANGTALVGANAARRGVWLYNDSDTIVWLGFSATGVTAANGIPLIPNQTLRYEPADYDRTYTGPIHGIHAHATDLTKNVRVQEW